MININKKILIMFLLVFAILCTAFTYSVNATESDVGYSSEDINGFIYYGEISGTAKNEYGDFDITILKGDLLGQLIIESLRQHSYDDGGYIPLSDLYEFYDVLCCQKGTKLPSINETYLKGSNGDRLNVSFPYLTMNDIGKEIFKSDDRREPFGSEVYTNLTLGFYVGGEINICRPKEAYILAEMVRELEGAIFYYDIQTDANGNKVKYEGSLEGAQSFKIGDEEVYIVEKEYVAVLPDGSLVQVEEVIGADGTVSYKYKEGSYQNQYVKYEGSLQWNDNKFGNGGTYPSFEYSSSNSNSSAGETQVPNGTQIYVTGSKVVIKEEDFYYNATVEGNNSYIQLAWWTTIAGGSGNTVNDTAFSQEAAAFEAYILEAAGVTSTDALEYTTETVIDENGEEKTYENAFKIEYNPAWVEDDDELKYPTTIFEADKQSFLVGPFSIDYIEAKAQFGGRPEVEFAGITDFELYTDASNEPLKYGEQWEFVYLDGERLEEDNEGTDGDEISYPGSNEKFYIRLFDSENATKITNMKVHFRYMNAAGSWQELHGKYFKATWEQQTKDFTKWVPCEWDEETGEPIDWEEVYDYTQYWLELTSMEEHDSQFLGLGIKAAKWYNTCTLERSVMNEGKIIIEKVIVDDEGNIVEDVDEDAYFDIKYSVNGAINSVTDERTRVRAGSSVESKVFYWTGDEAPTYSVEEIIDGNSDYELVSIEGTPGTLTAGNVALVTVTNRRKAPKEGYIDIIKLIEKNELTIDEKKFVGKEFSFNVTVNGTFEYKGETITDGSIIIPAVKVKAALDAGTAEKAVIGPFYWYDEAPSYAVEEEGNYDGITLEYINPESGYLSENEHVVVTAKNKIGIEEAVIKIIKVLKGSSHLNEDQVRDLNFTFKIVVKDIAGKEITNVIHLKRPTERNEDGDWTWVGLSDKFVWSYGENPTYEIFETPEETENTMLDRENSVMSGTLEQGETENPEVVYEIENVITNILKAPNTGKIQITKQVEDEELLNSDFKFVVRITGDNYKYNSPDGKIIEAFKSEDGLNGFIIDGNTIYGSALQLTNTGIIVLEEGEDYDNENFVIINTGSGSGTWESGEFSWYGDNAPRYEVEENLRGDDIASSIEPSEGFLSDTEGDNKVKVTAWNREITKPVSGYLHIIKTLENADKYTIDYVNSLVFKFKIEVENYEPFIKSLEAKRVDNTWVWEYTSDSYSWESDKEPLEYKITEIELPEGTEFVSASGPEGAIVSGTTITGKLKESKSEDVKITTDNSFINKLPGETPNSSNIVVEKKVVNPSEDVYSFYVVVKGTFEYNGTSYEDGELKIEGQVKAGEKVTIGPIKWYGDVAPEYSVVESATDAELNVSLINGSGNLSPVKDSEVYIINDPKKDLSGSFMIQKTFEGIGDPNGVYDFKITVKSGDGSKVISENTVQLKAGENYKSPIYTWKNGEKPYEVTVEEVGLPEGVTCVSSKSQTQSLNSEQIIEFKFVNKCEPKTGNFSVEKIALIEKIIDPKLLEQGFEIKVNITGELFGIANESKEIYYVGSNTFTITLKGGEKYTSPDIVWWGEKAPTVVVEETNLPFGWSLVGISNNGLSLEANKTLEIEVTNKLPFTPVIELTTRLAGEVWEDEAQDKDGKNTPDSVANGIKDAGESPVKGEVEVYIYKVIKDANGKEVERSLATVYKDINNTPLSLPIITSGDGTWNAPRVKIPTVDDDQEKQGYTAGYDVEFVYDGQTYEPTKFLATSNGDAAKFAGETTNGKDKYANDSMALDYDREVVNNRILTVKGKSVIDGSGDTFGTAVGNEKDGLLFYKSDAPENNVNDEKKSKSVLQTLNSDNSVKELFKAKARTSVGGLYFPVYKDLQNWNGFHLTNSDTKITELGMVQTLYYEAVYNYCLHINLGLVRRPDADVGMAKDLYSAKVTLKGEEITPIDGGTFRFNTLEDLNGDFYSRQVTNQQTVPYTLGLYSSDYYYRAEMYQDNFGLYDKVVELSKTIENNKFSEMEVELKYELALYNESKSYTQVIKGVNDYFDSSFGTPIKVEMPNGASANYKVTETGILGSDNVTYNKLEIEDMNLSLASGEVAKIYITFKVQKDTINGVHDTIILGQKSNVAEISSYSTLNQDGTNAGKVDKDSAPDNLNIRNYNEYSWYEDDTDAAPVLHLELKDENRIINGQVWEDKPEVDSTNGDGILNDGEALIGGLTTQLVEKVEVDGKVYDFIWPTREALNCLGGKSLKDLTGFDSIIETSRVNDEEKGVKVGSYEFTRIPSGNYVVRFLYGNDKTLLDDTLETTEYAEALNKDGSTFFADERILTANYDNDRVGSTPAVYNGQDYKTTIYQAGFASVDENGYVNNKVHDLTNAALNDSNNRVSDAMDSEARRLEIIANSETIMNENSNILNTANNIYVDCIYGEGAPHHYGEYAADPTHTDYVDHTELYRQYYMFADSGSIELKLENEEEETIIANIDCGLIERPETALVLDKEISSIKMTTNDNRVIFNADYDITYELTSGNLGDLSSKVIVGKVGDKYLIANIKLKDSSIGIDVLQAIDKSENKLASNREGNVGVQNFRFINIDAEMFQGTTIEVEYQLTVLNLGEVDYTSEVLNNMYKTSKANSTTEKYEITKLSREIKNNDAIADSSLEKGKYLGTNYYTGNVRNDQKVITRVRQVVDYVDNDFVFTQAMNVSDKNSWKNASITELKGNGYKEERLLDVTVLPSYNLVDKHGVSYITPYKNNVILTVDNMHSFEDLSVEKEAFIHDLIPYDESVNPEDYKSQITLIASKTVSAQDKDLSFDNIAEIVKYQNTVGRRDVLTVTGNANPKLGEFSESLEERDSSATELITFTPPTGIKAEITMKTQILIVIAIASVIAIAGIVIIKKKVL